MSYEEERQKLSVCCVPLKHTQRLFSGTEISHKLLNLQCFNSFQILNRACLNLPWEFCKIMIFQSLSDQLAPKLILETAQSLEKNPVRQLTCYVLHKLFQRLSLGIKSLWMRNISCRLAANRFELSLKFEMNFGNIFLEPIGSVAPKVNSGDDLKAVKAELNKSITLLCPAQAYPMPVFRLVRDGLFLSFFFEALSRLPFLRNDSPFLNYLWLEPISSTSPKIYSVDAHPTVVPQGAHMSILCPAQGYPAPSFRYHKLIS